MRSVHWRVEFIEQSETRVGDSRIHQPAVFSVARAVYKARLLEAIDQSRHIGNLCNEAFSNVFAAKSIGYRSAKNSKNVVLCRRNVEWLQSFDDRVAEERVGSLDAEHRLLLEAHEGTVLLDFFLEMSGHEAIYVL